MTLVAASFRSLLGALDHGGHPEQLLGHGGTDGKGQEGEDEPSPTLAAAQTGPVAGWCLPKSSGSAAPTRLYWQPVLGMVEQVE
jgi:hypothetical protein